MVSVKGKWILSVSMIQVVPGELGDRDVGPTWKSPWEAILQERCEEEVEGWGGQPEQVQGSGI